MQAGLPAVISMTMELPKADDVTIVTKGIYDYESEIDELMLIMFERNGRKEVIDLTGNIVADATGTSLMGGRQYNLLNDVTTLSGVYTVYAIANWSSPLCGITKAELEGMDMTALNNAFAKNPNSLLGVSGSDKFPMAKVIDNVEIYPLETHPDANILNLSLQRLISHIEVEFVDGGKVLNASPEVTKENPHFEPRSFAVYNIPKRSNLFSKTNNCLGKYAENEGAGIGCTAIDYGKSNKIEMGGINIITFYMLENVPSPKTPNNIKNYHDRDKWVRNDGANYVGPTPTSKKEFINAPDNSTFLLVEGEYTGTKYTGNVLYTIHLGNFTKSPGASLDNFNVNRNEYHKYKITINGVDKIVAEATVTDPSQLPQEQSGAEGMITENYQSQDFVLDAHFEQVMLKIPAQQYPNLHLCVYTPFHRMYTSYSLAELKQAADQKSFDYGWIQFKCPKNIGTTSRPNIVFPKYRTEYCEYELTPELIAPSDRKYHDYDYTKPKAGAKLKDIDKDTPCDIVTLMEELSKPVDVEKKHVLHIGDFYYIAAFVDEYFYPIKDQSTDWTQFVNNENREFIVTKGGKISQDGNSIFYGKDDRLFKLSQRSMKSIFAETVISQSGAIVGKPVAVETWDETGEIFFGDCFKTNTDNKKQTFASLNLDKNGYNNTKKLNSNIPKANEFDKLAGARGVGQGTKLDKDIFQTVGYGLNGQKPLDNTSASHVWKGSSSYVAYKACLLRNRDENGDGRINEEELKWYLPSDDQYVDMWVGGDFLQEDTRLFDPALLLTTGMTMQNNIKKYLYFTSQGSLYYGATASMKVLKESDISKTKGKVRCIRNLTPGAHNGYSEYTSELIDATQNIIVVQNVDELALRSNYMAGGEYTAGHLQNSEDNRLPHKFQVASKLVTKPYSTSVRLYSPDDIKANKNICASYTQDTGGADKGQWRVPNQRELLVMRLHGIYPQSTDPKATVYPYASSTFFTNNAGFDVAVPYYLTADKQISVEPITNAEITVNRKKQKVFRLNVRCVRDVK